MQPRELVKGAFGAYNAGGPSAFIDYLTGLDALDDGFVMEIQADLPNGGEWRGAEGFERMVRTWLEAWSEFEAVPEEPVELAEARYLVPVRQRAVARSSGMKLDAPFFYTVELAAGRIKRIGLFAERDLAERDLLGE